MDNNMASYCFLRVFQYFIRLCQTEMCVQAKRNNTLHLQFTGSCEEVRYTRLPGGRHP